MNRTSKQNSEIGEVTDTDKDKTKRGGLTDDDVQYIPLSLSTPNYEGHYHGRMHRVLGKINRKRRKERGSNGMGNIRLRM